MLGKLKTHARPIAAAVAFAGMCLQPAWADLTAASMEGDCDGYLLTVSSTGAFTNMTSFIDYSLTVQPPGGGAPIVITDAIEYDSMGDPGPFTTEIFRLWSEVIPGGLGDGLHTVTGTATFSNTIPIDMGGSQTLFLECVSGGSFCGDGILDEGEDCDDGNNVDGDGCRSDCTQELCGDGVLDAGEICDDGNNANGDGCRADCTVEICGDGQLDPNEQCDDGNNADGDGCQADCSLPVCGDGVLDPDEQCDDGNNLDGDGCSSSCQAEVCGNGVLDPDEQCDDGNANNGDGCRNDCTIEVCGDGILDAGEQCDDGNNADGDGCSSQCTVEIVGGEGCTPGYWKQPHHFDSWTSPYTPETLFADVFENAFPGMTLLEVASQGGGGLKALGRHTVAALLNGASSGVAYDESVQGVIDQFNAVFPGTKGAYNTLKNSFQNFNEQGCPLN